MRWNRYGPLPSVSISSSFLLAFLDNLLPLSANFFGEILNKYSCYFVIDYAFMLIFDKILKTHYHGKYFWGSEIWALNLSACDTSS